VRIRGIQRDLVNRIYFTCNWLKLYKHKYKIRLGLENGTERTKKTLGIGGVPGWILLWWSVGMAERMFWCWFCFGFEGASSGSAGLVAFWLFLRG
jgi:hypothetical protein